MVKKIIQIVEEKYLKFSQYSNNKCIFRLFCDISQVKLSSSSFIHQMNSLSRSMNLRKKKVFWFNKLSPLVSWSPSQLIYKCYIFYYKWMFPASAERVKAWNLKVMRPAVLGTAFALQLVFIENKVCSDEVMWNMRRGLWGSPPNRVKVVGPVESTLFHRAGVNVM